jgi:hypothetical protein
MWGRNLTEAMAWEHVEESLILRPHLRRARGDGKTTGLSEMADVGLPENLKATL